MFASFAAARTASVTHSGTVAMITPRRFVVFAASPIDCAAVTQVLES